jgi:HTH-type transcriptional regulator / antitoxin HipB
MPPGWWKKRGFFRLARSNLIPHLKVKGLARKASMRDEVEVMSDLDSYVDERKKRDKGFAEGFDEGYEQFKIGEVLRQAREAAGLTQEELAIRVHTKKTAISRIENHAEDIKISTLKRVAKALGKRIQILLI